MVKKTKPSSGECAPDGGREVKIEILTGNVAVVRPPAEELPALLPYSEFLLEDRIPGGYRRGKEEALAREHSPSSTFPAGLVPRMQDALTKAGYRVVVDDRREFGEPFRIYPKYFRRTFGEDRAFLRGARRQPQGYMGVKTWYDVVCRVTALSGMFLDARILIVTYDRNCAVELAVNLRRYLHGSVGLLPQEYVKHLPQRMVCGLKALPSLRSGAWDILVLAMVQKRTLTEETWRRVLRLRAPRVYALVSGSVRLGPRSRPRMEAIAGTMMAPFVPP